MQNANNDQAHVSGLGKGRVGSRQGKKSKTLRVKYKYNLTDQMCVMFMYFSVCAVPDPKKGPKYKTRGDAEDNEGKESKKSSTCVVL